jgi:hypothetical protein
MPTKLRGAHNSTEDGLTPCKACHSANQRTFTAEINIHLPGRRGLDIPTVWVFPSILVCMDCGTAQLTIPEAERKELANRDYRRSADKSAA